MDNNARLQDIVASTAKVSLKDTVKVLRTLPMVLRHLKEPGAAARIETLLHGSAQVDGKPACLHDKPGILNAEACYNLQDELLDRYGAYELQNVAHLIHDPYFDRE